MLTLDNLYNDEIIEASYSEMVALAKWMNKYHAHYPTIVGGWAVWCYTKGLGSRDIDVVFLSREAKHATLITFLKSSGYEEAGTLFEKRFVKKIKTKLGMEEVIIDACSVEDLNRLKENDEIILPWSWAAKYSNKFELEPNVFVNLPRLEVILLYKTKAVLDRKFDLMKVGSSGYLESKIWKDFHDIASLLRCDLDKKFLERLSKDANYTDYFNKALDLLASREDIIKKLNVLDAIERIKIGD